MKNIVTDTNADLNAEWDMPHDVGDEPWDMSPTELMPLDSGDGSGEDDLADYNQNESSDYING